MANDNISVLTNGIGTKNPAFQEMLMKIAIVALNRMATNQPILLTGRTGVGKSSLARNIYKLKRNNNLNGAKGFVEVNCSNIRGELAQSKLFGHVKGAFTGAISDRPGMLAEADNGILFLDEISELGLEEQSMLLRALDNGEFIAVGADKLKTSTFQLIAGTNRDLVDAVNRGQFREDLLARIKMWCFQLPTLSDRPEDIEPNLDYQLEEFNRKLKEFYPNSNIKSVDWEPAAKQFFLRFAKSKDAIWAANFRELRDSLFRMATLAPDNNGCIDLTTVENEICELKNLWKPKSAVESNDLLTQFLSIDQINNIDAFDRIQLIYVIETCRQSKSAADAGGKLFQATLRKTKNPNFSDRVLKYLKKKGLTWDSIKA